MILYAESSAILSWLIGEPTSREVAAALTGAERVVTSALTGVECARSLSRARHQGRITRVEELAALQLYASREQTWYVSALSERILVRAKAPLPNDPVRALDALHVASALVMQEEIGPLAVLSLDARRRASAHALGFEVLPA